MLLLASALQVYLFQNFQEKQGMRCTSFVKDWHSSYMLIVNRFRVEVLQNLNPLVN